MVFDPHMHIGDFPAFGVSLDRDGLIALMEESGIDDVIVFHPDNAQTQTVVESSPHVYGLAWINPRVPGYVDETRHYLDHPRFLGVKLHPLLDGYLPADPSIDPVMELLGERSMPVLLHTGHPIFSLPWSIEDLAVKFPQNAVVMGHMGHGNIVYINAAIDIAARRPNVYLETSGMPMHTKVREAVERLGPERVMYGSDAPFHHPSVELLKVKLSGLPEQLIDRITDDTARDLFLSGRVTDHRR